ncbi:MAG: 50S ribosomal protein L15 [Gammaproteobacteria bacterium]|nr:50S ribosomal protein L15 [Gammaproteobacteria bacterium]MYK68499.1 50S ribosomal protein L15 [Gammaproteobacteria bacterium]
MSELHRLSPVPGSRKARKRVGRGPGSGLGKTAGRGHNGQKSRSGGTVPAWFEGGQMPLQRRIPKRGFKNRGRVEYAVINVGDLNRLDTDRITLEALVRAGVAGGGRKPVKVLGTGEAKRAMHVEAHAFSASARRKIEAAGGTVTVSGSR